MAGNSFSVTVSAPNAPWMQTQIRLTVGHQGLRPAHSGTLRARRQLSSVSAMISTPTPVAR